MVGWLFIAKRAEAADGRVCVRCGEEDVEVR